MCRCICIMLAVAKQIGSQRHKTTFFLNWQSQFIYSLNINADWIPHREIFKHCFSADHCCKRSHNRLAAHISSRAAVFGCEMFSGFLLTQIQSFKSISTLSCVLPKAPEGGAGRTCNTSRAAGAQPWPASYQPGGFGSSFRSSAKATLKATTGTRLPPAPRVQVVRERPRVRVRPGRVWTKHHASGQKDGFSTSKWDMFLWIWQTWKVSGFGHRSCILRDSILISYCLSSSRLLCGTPTHERLLLPPRGGSAHSLQALSEVLNPCQPTE